MNLRWNHLLTASIGLLVGCSSAPPSNGSPYTAGGGGGDASASGTAGGPDSGAAVGPGADAGAPMGSPNGGGTLALPDGGAIGSDGAVAAGSGTDASGAPNACDRACLLAMMSTYLNALVARDSSKVPVASGLKYTENGVVTQLGSGLWMTASALVPDERLDFADPVAGQVASQLVVNENGTSPVIYMVRLKVVSHQIAEIESMAVRQAGAANGFFTPANMKPQPVFTQMIDPSMAMTRDQLTKLTNTYLDYLDGKVQGASVPFDTNCARYENGVATASGVASFDAQSWGFNVVRRILIIDEEAGITWGMFPFEMTSPALVVGEAFKMVGGKIMMIQAVMANMPANAWN
jgi:hypothetical protein